MAKYWQQSILDEIIRLIEAGQMHLLVGAGLSKLAGYPLWDELLKEFADEYKNVRVPYKGTDDEHQELINLASQKKPVLITRLLMLGTEGLKGYGKVLCKHFCSERHVEEHEQLVALPFAGYITINYDRCLESAWKKVRGRDFSNGEWLCFPPHEKATQKNITEMMSCVKQKGWILHMHGCIYHQECFDVKNIILTQDQYSKHYADDYQKGLQQVFDNILNQHLLILGTSFNDPYFMQRFLRSRDPLDENRVNRRKTAYIIFRRADAEENNYSPKTDKEVYDLEHIYYSGDMEDGPKALINELKGAYESRKKTVYISK